jgi:bacteriorhodopsin
MVVAEQTLYAASAVLLFLGTLGMTALVRRFDGAAARHVRALPVVLAILGLGYVGMALDLFVVFSPEGEPVYMTRTAAYMFTYTFLMGYVGLVSGAKRRYRLIPAAGVVGFNAATPVIQLLGPPVSLIGAILIFLSLIAVYWAFFGPLTRAAKDIPRNRRLLFLKLRNLAALIFIMYMLVSFTSRQALGLLDAFTGVFTVTYVDLVGHFGLAGLIIFSTVGVEMVANDHSSPFEMLSAPEASRSPDTTADD